MRFLDRSSAGQLLAEKLRPYQKEAPLVIALPRGGVPVGYEVARALGAPLEVLVVRKLGAPFQPELGLGAIAEGGVVVLDEPLVVSLGVNEAELEEVIARESKEVERRIRVYREGKGLPDLKDRVVVLVDDGIATGGTIKAALQTLRALSPRKLILAVPVAASQTLEQLQGEADELICLVAPLNLVAIGYWYQDFQQVPDAEVLSLLGRARKGQPAEARQPSPLGK